MITKISRLAAEARDAGFNARRLLGLLAALIAAVGMGSCTSSTLTSEETISVASHEDFEPEAESGWARVPLKRARFLRVVAGQRNRPLAFDDSLETRLLAGSAQELPPPEDVRRITITGKPWIREIAEALPYPHTVALRTLDTVAEIEPILSFLDRQRNDWRREPGTSTADVWLNIELLQIEKPSFRLLLGACGSLTAVHHDPSGRSARMFKNISNEEYAELLSLLKIDDWLRQDLFGDFGNGDSEEPEAAADVEPSPMETAEAAPVESAAPANESATTTPATEPPAMEATATPPNAAETPSAAEAKPAE